MSADKMQGKILNKKAVSVMIGYILLVVFVIIIGVFVYNWLKTYVPSGSLECPDGVSIFIESLSFDQTDSILSLTVTNNGRFNVAGYFIHASNNSEQELETLDFSSYLDESSGGVIFGTSILFVLGGENSFESAASVAHSFNIPIEIGEPYSVKVIPLRFQIEKNKERVVSCGSSGTEQVVSDPCVPDCDDGRECGFDPACGTSCGDCVTLYEEGYVCNAEYQCELEADCDDTCADLGVDGYECETHTICGVENVDCGDCVTSYGGGYVCDETFQCIFIPGCGNSVLEEAEGEECDDGGTEDGDGCSALCIIEYCGDGIVQQGLGETCDDGNTDPPPADGCSTSCTVDIGWVCDQEEPNECTLVGGGAPSCINYCITLELGYTSSDCPAVVGQCTSQDGDLKPDGNVECIITGGSQDDDCCCHPKYLG